MKRRFLALIAAGVFVVSIAGCGSTSTASNTTETNSVSEKTQDASLVQEENNDYSDLISMMEDEDYDGAIAYIEDCKTQKQIEEAGDIEDYLVEVELTEDNFNDYFEFDIAPQFDSFGEEVEDCNVFILKSKKYDEGLVVYEMDDDIALEYTVTKAYGDSYEADEKLTSYTLGNVHYPNQIVTGITLDRLNGGKITFVKAEYVESYEESEEANSDNNTTSYEIKLKNGEIIWHYAYPGNKY